MWVLGVGRLSLQLHQTLTTKKSDELIDFWQIKTAALWRWLKCLSCVFINLCVHQPVCPSTCMSINLCVHQPVCPSTCVSINLCVHQPVCSSPCVSINLGVHSPVCSSIESFLLIHSFHTHHAAPAFYVDSHLE